MGASGSKKTMDEAFEAVKRESQNFPGRRRAMEMHGDRIRKGVRGTLLAGAGAAAGAGAYNLYKAYKNRKHNREVSRRG